jgi:uncharacterized membrane protein YdfJ with MMPL/SSD domain
MYTRYGPERKRRTCRAYAGPQSRSTYALIVVMRSREERERGAGTEETVPAAVGTAGRAVVFSGTTVAVGLLVAPVLPIPFLRSMVYVLTMR